MLCYAICLCGLQFHTHTYSDCTCGNIAYRNIRKHTRCPFAVENSKKKSYRQTYQWTSSSVYSHRLDVFLCILISFKPSRWCLKCTKRIHENHITNFNTKTHTIALNSHSEKGRKSNKKNTRARSHLARMVYGIRMGISIHVAFWKHWYFTQNVSPVCGICGIKRAIALPLKRTLIFIQIPYADSMTIASRRQLTLYYFQAECSLYSDFFVFYVRQNHRDLVMWLRCDVVVNDNQPYISNRFEVPIGCV